jgi:hypothetical protein
VIAILGIVGYVIWNSTRNHRRRKSLHQDDAGFWVWTEYNGTTCRSEAHPGRPGGEWCSGGQSDGGGFDSDSDGGDGGD